MYVTCMTPSEVSLGGIPRIRQATVGMVETTA